MTTPKKPVHAEGAPVETADDEVVHVPKGKSKLRFVLTLGLMLFVLVIFTVGDQFMGTFSRSSGGDPGAAYMTWVHPQAGPQSVSWIDFTNAKRQLDAFFRVQGLRPPPQETSDERIAYLLITDRLARDAGVGVADVELGRMLREGHRVVTMRQGQLTVMEQPRAFFNSDNYKAALGSAKVSAASFEATLAWLARVSRYEGMIVDALATPAPAAIEQAWKDQHNEYAFELVGLRRDDLRADAEREELDEAGLKGWYEALDLGEKGRLFRDQFVPERIAAELVSWTPGGELPQGLLARFPPNEEIDPAVAGKNHYELFKHVRYRRPEGAATDGEATEGEASEGESADSLSEELYRPFEEVSASATDEARVRAALEALLADLRARKAAGETLDLAALAAELGLEHHNDGLPRSVDDWSTTVDPELVIYLRTPGEGNLLRQSVVGATRLWLGQVLERLPSAPPAFEDVTAQAREAWIEQRSGELARERLQKVYDALVAKAGSTPVEGAPAPAQVDASDADFAAALSEAGLAAEAIEWFDPARDADDADSEAPGMRFLREGYFPGAPLYALAAGQVAAPQTALDDESVWLARGKGKREPQALDLRPSEYQSLRQGAFFDGMSKVFERVTSPETLAQRYQVRWPMYVEEDGGAADGQAPAGG